MTSYDLFSKDYSWNMKVVKNDNQKTILTGMDSHNLIPTFPHTQDFACPHANDF